MAIRGASSLGADEGEEVKMDDHADTLEDEGVLFVDGDDEDEQPMSVDHDSKDQVKKAREQLPSSAASRVKAEEEAQENGGLSSDSSEEEKEEEEEEEDEEEEADESGSDDDPVVREIDVYLRRLDTSSATSVYVLQYPLRPLYRPYGDHGQLLEVAYRERQRTLQFAYGLHTGGDNFDPSHPMNVEAERAGSSGCDDPAPGGKTGATERSEERRPKHILKSQRALAGDCSYAVGILKKDKIFITPVDHVLQFRPDFTQIEQLQKASYPAGRRLSASGDSRAAAPALRRRNEEKDKLEAAPAGSGEAPAAETARGDAPRAGAATRPGGERPATVVANSGEGRGKISHSRQRDIEESEQWLTLETFYDADTPEALDIIRTLCSTPVASDDEDEKTEEDLLAEPSAAPASSPPSSASQDILFVSNTRSYLRALCGHTAEKPSTGGSAAQNAAHATGPLGYGALAKLSPDQQVFTILRHRHVESFATIQRLLTAPMAESDLLRLLLQYAVLVLGNWAIKSMYVYDDMYEISCRDLLLALLIRSGSAFAPATQGAPGGDATLPSSVGLPKEAFRSATRLPVDRVTQMLQEVAVCSSSAWRLKIPPDTSFLAAHPAIQKHFDQWWRQRLQQVVKEVHQRRDARASPQGAAAAGEEGKTKDAAAAVSPALLQLAGRLCSSVLKAQGALTFQQLRETLNSKNDDFLAVADRDLERVLQTVAIQVGTVWIVPKVGNAQSDLYRDCLIEVLKKQTQPQSKATIVQEMTQALNRRVDLPDFTLRKLLRELAVNEGGFWSFKGRATETGDGDVPLPQGF
ncbi:putative SIN-like domain-containing protein [Neospora caninum Liverpool]|uniref:Putative SIN-like domain-containing protein n=1 Tax=Neospora caninum (strain Liverpool) TaxID=572307 RepID=F0VBK0_NEOCL|nr:putative SIN-like domain-containing protein [Neospora caninum Liverpool]CBZ50984.1 putative SIN-like domain-containing protein [Neospora caninum Liverpool]CEL68287.1 TPA: SIN-like domain-containing protein, putative [Neospora caninum Liverpool]|eukprot:XP_003881017.1 putative SIN-like domain-containing protein [Neospora caninum Liverpool]